MQEELRGLDKIKNDAQVMKMRNKLNMRNAHYAAFKLRQELTTLKKELKKIRKEYQKAGKGEDLLDIEERTINEMLNSHPAGKLIEKLEHNDKAQLSNLMDKSVPYIKKLLSKRILTPEFNDRIFQEEFGDKTVTPKDFKAAEKSYMARVSGKIFDEDNFSPAKGEEKIPYLEKCHKDYKKACVRFIVKLPITLPILAIVLTSFATVAVASDVVLGAAWAWKKISNANARMLGKQPRSSVRFIDKISGKNPKLFGDYKRVAFPVLQSSLAIVAAGAFAAFGTNDKDNPTMPDVVPTIEQHVKPVKTPLPEKTEASKNLQNKTLASILIEKSTVQTKMKANPHVAVHLRRMKGKSIG